MKETLKKTIVFIGVPVFLASMLSVVAVNADISDHAKDESGLSAAVSTGGVPASNDVCFDNISLYSVSGGETLMAEDELIDEITNEGYMADGYYENFEGEFEEVVFTSTTSESTNTVIKGGNIKETNNTYYNINMLQPDVMTVDISVVEDDEQHGRVLKFDLIKATIGTRGIYFRPEATINADFIVYEFEFKLPDINSAIGIWVAGGTFQGYLNLAGELDLVGRYDSTGSLSVNTSFANYFSPSELEDGHLKTNTWHKAKYLVDMTHATYDFFINDTLITADAAKRSLSSAALTEYLYTMMGAQFSGSVAYFDNVRTYQVTEKYAADITKIGLDNLIGNGQIADRLLDNKTMYLPFSGAHGAYPSQCGYGNIILNGEPFTGYGYGDRETLSYTLSGENTSQFEIVNTHQTYTIIDSTQDLFVPVDMAYNGNISSSVMGNNYLKLTAGRAAGTTSLDKEITLNAVVQKGETVLNVSYPLVFKRFLQESYIDGLEVGEASSSAIGTDVQYASYVKNFSDVDVAVRLMCIGYDSMGGLCYLKGITKDIVSGQGQEISLSQSFAIGSDAVESSLPGGFITKEVYESMQSGTVKFVMWIRNKVLPVTTISTHLLNY